MPRKSGVVKKNIAIFWTVSICTFLCLFPSCPAGQDLGLCSAGTPPSQHELCLALKRRECDLFLSFVASCSWLWAVPGLSQSQFVLSQHAVHSGCVCEWNVCQCCSRSAETDTGRHRCITLADFRDTFSLCQGLKSKSTSAQPVQKSYPWTWTQGLSHLKTLWQLFHLCFPSHLNVDELYCTALCSSLADKLLCTLYLINDWSSSGAEREEFVLLEVIIQNFYDIS